MRLEYRDLATNTTLVVHPPSWQDVKSAIEGLDRWAYGDLALSAGACAHFGVGGGAGQLVVCIVLLVEARELHLAAHSPDARPVVDLGTALTAARAFFETQQPAPSIDWERQDEG